MTISFWEDLLSDAPTAHWFREIRKKANTDLDIKLEKKIGRRIKYVFLLKTQSKILF